MSGPESPRPKPWYDRADGIREAVQTLEGFHRLIAARHEAGYDRHERLSDFYLRGRWATDSCGNVGRILPPLIPKDVLPAIDDVVTKEELWQALRDALAEGEGVSWSPGEATLPPTRIVCGECGARWTIADCHDAVVVHETQSLSLASHIGATLADVKRAYSNRTDAAYWMQDDILIRNDSRIDDAHKRGWVSKRDGIDDDYFIQEGDEGHFNVWQYYHVACQRRRLARVQEEQFRSVFAAAGIPVLGMVAVPNEYCGCIRCAPWYDVATPIGTFRLGWRKRVINIDWSRINGIPTDSFVGEDVTMGATFIHAWGNDKAAEYLSRMQRSFVPTVS